MTVLLIVFKTEQTLKFDEESQIRLVKSQVCLYLKRNIINVSKLQRMYVEALKKSKVKIIS